MKIKYESVVRYRHYKYIVKCSFERKQSKRSVPMRSSWDSDERGQRERKDLNKPKIQTINQFMADIFIIWIMVKTSGEGQSLGIGAAWRKGEREILCCNT